VLVVNAIISFLDTAPLISVIICCTTVTALNMSSREDALLSVTWTDLIFVLCIGALLFDLPSSGLMSCVPDADAHVSSASCCGPRCNEGNELRCVSGGENSSR